MIRVKVPATTANLGPGYDCLGLALSLYNEMSFTAADEWSLEISGFGASELPRNVSNLAWKASCRLWQEIGQVPPAVQVQMHNAIPLSRGLGSSAAAIVGGLLLANAWAGNPLTQPDVVELATEMEGHPDNVAPAILGGLVASGQASETVFTARFEPAADYRFVVCIPDFKLATKIARQALPQTVSHEDAVFNVTRTSLMLAGLIQGRDDLVSAGGQDRLHQPYRKHLIPAFEQVTHGAMQAGATTAVISGAGPTMLAIVSGDADADQISQAMVTGFNSQGVSATSLTLPPDLCGAQIILR